VWWIGKTDWLLCIFELSKQISERARWQVKFPFFLDLFYLGLTTCRIREIWRTSSFLISSLFFSFVGAWCFLFQMNSPNHQTKRFCLSPRTPPNAFECIMLGGSWGAGKMTLFQPLPPPKIKITLWILVANKCTRTLTCSLLTRACICSCGTHELELISYLLNIRSRTKFGHIVFVTTLLSHAPQ
jgi:hypothetical protein